MLRLAAAAAARTARGAAPASTRGNFYLTALADGSVGQNATRSGTLIGEDAQGNKYYENRSYQAGRHRWVTYADRHDYSARAVPRDWHGWLHSITDAAPTKVVQYHPPYEVPAFDGLYGSPTHAGVTAYAPASDVHLPKGHLKQGRKSWQRFTEWKPAA